MAEIKKEKKNKQVKLTVPKMDISNNQQSVQTNEYFIKLSAKFKRAKLISAIALILFVVIMTASYRDVITLTNFQYLIRDLVITNTVYTYDTDQKIISYNTDINSVFELFRGSLALSNTSGFSLYSLSGARIMNESHNYKNPALASSSSYLVVYDLGGNTYSVYNTLTKLDSQTLNYAIYAAAVSENGTYAVVSRDSEYRTVIHVYNSKCEKISQIMKDKLTTDISFSSDGKELIVATVYNIDGQLDSEITVCDPYSDEAPRAYMLTGIMAVRACMTKAGGFTVVTDKNLQFYNHSGVKLNEYSYMGYMPSNSYCDSEYASLIFNKNVVGEENEIHIFDYEGNEKLEQKFEGRVVNTTRSGKYFYVLCSGSVVRINLETGEIKDLEIAENPSDIIVSDENMLICYYSYTVVYPLAESFESEAS